MPAQLRHHPLRGAIFETWVFSELYKGKVHRGEMPQLFHFRGFRGLEVTFIEPQVDRIRMVEAKPGEQFEKQLVYGGSEALTRSGVQVVPWNQL